MKLKIVYIIPAHNEALILREQMLRFLERHYDIEFKVLIIENKSSDNTYEVARLLESDYPNIYTAITIPDAGIGHAYYKGIIEALKFCNSDDWICLSAADLPFGFSDFREFLKNINSCSKLKDT